MKKSFPWRAALTAVALYTTAFLLTAMAHELAHALVSKSLGGQPVLYHSSVRSLAPNLTDRMQLAIAAAGPLLSLVQGLVFLGLARRREGNGNAALLGLYLGLFGMINFLGYVFTGPFVPYGDLGKVEALLHLPTGLTLAAALLAMVVLGLVVARTGPLFLRFGPGLSRPGRGQLLLALVALPWLLGAGLITGLSWPAPTLLSLIYPPMSSMVLGAAYGRAIRQPYPTEAAMPAALLPALQLGPALLGLAVAAIIFRLLATGVPL
jgi:hypothetical protein